MKSKCSVLNYQVMILPLFVAAALAMATITGCAAKVVKPIKNISDAEMAIKMAIENSATVNAPLDVRIAEDKLQKAREAAKREDFILAQRLADEASMDARVAEVKSQTQKIKRMEKDLRDSIETLQNEVNRNQQRYY
ncbi:MAG: DUF4398 domain-containing protein [Desulfamplus sp.]|nr:DUF4398 domain-containing protein [Desulfamplus sp.]MBF0412921.1 DUF4398 domain-containing protein [Desulfamplus sp.]